MRSDHAGAGLGAAIVRSIVQAHDGTPTVTSRPDGGLRVSAVLPAGAGR
ncbi:MULTISPECIES: ATP-binding protein [Arthrobacter]